MSIINEAIKKARRESKITNKYLQETTPKKEEVRIAGSSELKWTAIITTSLVVIAALFGSLFLYKYMSGTDVAYEPVSPEVKRELTLTFGESREKTEFPAAEIDDMVELNGIVSGPKDKWAIINNKIVREGELFLNGRVTRIAEDYVRIKKDTGEEVVLELK